MENYLANKNSHVRDSRIALATDNDQHTYYIDGVPAVDYTSVTKVVEKLAKVKPFNRILIANQLAKTADKSSANYGMTPEDFINKWDLSEKAGTHLHNCIERYYNRKAQIHDGFTVPEDYTLPDEAMREWNFFLKFDKEYIDALGYEPFRVEWWIFDDDVRYCGTPDAIFKHTETGKFLLVDWKRSEIIHKGSKNFSPSKLRQYHMQVNVYAEMIARKYDITIDKMILVVLHPTRTLYECLDVPFDSSIGEIMNKKTIENESVHSQLELYME